MNIDRFADDISDVLSGRKIDFGAELRTTNASLACASAIVSVAEDVLSIPQQWKLWVRRFGLLYGALALPSRLRKNSSWQGFASGNAFTRVVNASKSMRATVELPASPVELGDALFQFVEGAATDSQSDTTNQTDSATGGSNPIELRVAISVLPSELTVSIHGGRHLPPFVEEAMREVTLLDRLPSLKPNGGKGDSERNRLHQNPISRDG